MLDVLKRYIRRYRYSGESKPPPPRIRQYSGGSKLPPLLLAPWSWLYAFVMYVRNRYYDLWSGRSRHCGPPVTARIEDPWQRDVAGLPPHTTIISIGNLAMGGTGKTPCIEYLLSLLQPNFHVAVVSRGYKRKTTDERIATSTDNAWTLGDEPYQLYKKFAAQGQRTHIVVGKDRVKAISKLLATHPATKVILLDDGFQHRRVHRDLNILLTTFERPFFIDHPLPMGRLRESRQAAKRADVVLVTKCPYPLTADARFYFKQHITKYTGRAVPIFFTYIRYGSPRSLGTAQAFTGDESVMLLTGIADTKPLVQYVSTNYRLIQHFSFRDHHRFTQHDIRSIIATFHQISHKKKCILTTEKDSMRLMHPTLAPFMKDVPIFVLPMWMAFEEGEKEFNQLIFDCINEGGAQARLPQPLCYGCYAASQ